MSVLLSCSSIGLRVEYCKAYARVRRWREQVELVRAEMQYCLGSLEYQVRWWKERAVIPAFADEHAEGAAAYAHKQAAVRALIAQRFRIQWARHLIGVAPFVPTTTTVFDTIAVIQMQQLPLDDGTESDEELGGSDAERDEADKEEAEVDESDNDDSADEEGN